VELDAGEQAAAVAESLSQVEDGDVFGAEGGYDTGSRFLECDVEREEAVYAVSAVDSRDEGAREFAGAVVRMQV
jgi:hypothetical protein